MSKSPDLFARKTAIRNMMEGPVAVRIVFMNGGVVVAAGTPAEVPGAPKSLRLREFLSNMSSFQELPP